MNEIMAIAGGTWRRILRMRVVYFLVVCVLILIGSSVNYDILSMGEHKPLMIDVSLVLNTVAAVPVAISITFPPGFIQRRFVSAAPCIEITVWTLLNKWICSCKDKNPGSITSMLLRRHMLITSSSLINLRCAWTLDPLRRNTVRFSDFLLMPSRFTSPRLVIWPVNADGLTPCTKQSSEAQCCPHDIGTKALSLNPIRWNVSQIKVGTAAKSVGIKNLLTPRNLFSRISFGAQ